MGNYLKTQVSKYSSCLSKIALKFKITIINAIKDKEETYF